MTIVKNAPTVINGSLSYCLPAVPGAVRPGPGELPSPRHPLDGRDGTNRNRARVNQLGVEDDIAAVTRWLADSAGASTSKKTHQVYLSQARRLLWWAHTRCVDTATGRVGKALSSLTREDLIAYRAFLKNPDSDSCSARKAHYWRRDGGANPRWRPFTGPLTPAHIAHVLGILKELFSYLATTGYLDGDPLAGVPTRQKGSVGDRGSRGVRPTERALDEVQWAAVLVTVEQLPRASRTEIYDYERARFLVRLFYHLGARIGEIATHTMGDFEREGEYWVWQVTGKGGVNAKVPVNPELWEALLRYRRFLRLPTEEPRAKEATPLIASKRSERGIGAAQLYRIIKNLFARAADRLEASDSTSAARLRQASPHWIRHAVASHKAHTVKTAREVEVLRRLMRHRDTATTLAYVHVDDAELREMANRAARPAPAAAVPATTSTSSTERGEKTTTVTLTLFIENNSKFVRGKKRARQEIEDFHLSDYAMRKLNEQEYELTFSYRDEKNLEQQVYDLISDMAITAEDRHCFIEVNVKENGTERVW